MAQVTQHKMSSNIRFNKQVAHKIGVAIAMQKDLIETGPETV